LNDQKGGNCSVPLPANIIRSIVPLFELEHLVIPGDLIQIPNGIQYPLYNYAAPPVGNVPPTDIGNIIALNINTSCDYNYFNKYEDKQVVVIDFANIIGQICSIILNDEATVRGIAMPNLNTRNINPHQQTVYDKFANLLSNIQKDSYIYIFAKPIFGITIEECMNYYFTNRLGLALPTERIGNLIFNNIIVYSTFYFDYTVPGYNSIPIPGGGDDYLFWLLTVCLYNIVKLLNGDIRLITCDKQRLTPAGNETKTIFNDIIPTAGRLLSHVPPINLATFNPPIDIGHIQIGIKKLDLDRFGNMRSTSNMYDINYLNIITDYFRSETINNTAIYNPGENLYMSLINNNLVWQQMTEVRQQLAETLDYSNFEKKNMLFIRLSAFTNPASIDIDPLIKRNFYPTDNDHLVNLEYLRLKIFSGCTNENNLINYEYPRPFNALDMRQPIPICTETVGIKYIYNLNRESLLELCRYYSCFNNGYLNHLMIEYTHSKYSSDYLLPSKKIITKLSGTIPRNNIDYYSLNFIFYIRMVQCIIWGDYETSILPDEIRLLTNRHNLLYNLDSL
jgi:hypothetical protein